MTFAYFVDISRFSDRF